jgi:predicted O-methyltransferase YrrM
MILSGDPKQLEAVLWSRDANLGKVLERSAAIPAQLYRYQAMALYLLAKPYNGLPVLEIGTGQGYSTSLIAQACPHSAITTLNPDHAEAQRARQLLSDYPNVALVEQKSWDYVVGHKSRYGFIFVDGDHKHVAQDLIWWKRLLPGGLMLFHDYDQVRSGDVFNVLNQIMKEWGTFDVFILDSNKAGLVGWQKRNT